MGLALMSFQPDSLRLFVLLALILELQTAKVNSQIMDIPAGETDKLCRIFTKCIGFYTRFSQFVNIWYSQFF